MHFKYRLCAFASIMTLATVLSSVPAVAQDSNDSAATEAEAAAQPPADAPDASANEADSGDIVVTAQKRAENVQDVPISIAAFSGETLEKNNVVNLEGLGKVTPNLSIAKGAQTSYVRLAVRGIGAASNTTVEPSVAVFLDGAYVPRVGAVISSMLDMESVEVLRGPQGTLFGRNASVGAVSFHTARPKFGDFSGEVTGEIGNGDRYKASGYVNVPVGEKSAFRFAGSQQWFKGYWHNELDDKQVGGTDDTILRGSFRARSRPGRMGVPRRLCQAERRRRDQHRLRPEQRVRRAVGDLQHHPRRAGHRPQRPDMNQFLTADVDDEQWGLNSTLSWDIGGGSTIRLINNYRDWDNEQLDGDVIFTPSPDPVAYRPVRFQEPEPRAAVHFAEPSSGWTAASTWSPASITSTRSISRAKTCT